MPLLSPNQQCQNTEGIKCKCKGKVNRAPQESIGGAQLPLQGFEPVGGEPLMSVTQGQCGVRPTVTFPTARHHRPLAGTKLYCLVTEARVLTTCLRLHSTAAGIRTRDLLITSPALYCYATEPHTEVIGGEGGG